MTPERAHRIVQTTKQLAEALMTAAICADEIRAAMETELDGHKPVVQGRLRDPGVPGGLTPNGRPLVDHSTFSVIWGGKTCYLGYTVLFRLADRLSRRPNQYVAPEQLLRDVWEGGYKSPETIRSTVRNLRQRLTQAGMGDLAATIHGAGGRYGMILDSTK